MERKAKTHSKKLKKIDLKVIQEEDRISDLHDGILLDILSLLPATKDTIKTGTLSKRWEHVWTLVPNLIFKNNDKYSFDDFSSFIDKTLTQCRHLNLNKFKVDTYNYHYRFESRVNNWIPYVVQCNVRELELLFDPNLGFSQYEFKLDEFFYTNLCCTHLNLKGCLFNPSATIRWKNLRSLSITYGKLHEDSIRNILSGSPLLETLELSGCYGFRRIDITSKSVKNLAFSGYENYDLGFGDMNIIEINAPYILSLAIQKRLYLSKLILLSMSSLVKANLDYEMGFYFKSTKKKEDANEMLNGLILSLRHVKDLTFGNLCQLVKVLSYWQL